MTPAERALLLAVAKELLDRIPFMADRLKAFAESIAAVEAEAAPEAPSKDKSCENCGRGGYMVSPVCACCVRDRNNLFQFPHWQPKSTEADVLLARCQSVRDALDGKADEDVSRVFEGVTIPPASALDSWQPSYNKRGASGVCLRCFGRGTVVGGQYTGGCPDCGGTGKKEKK